MKSNSLDMSRLFQPVNAAVQLTNPSRVQCYTGMSSRLAMGSSVRMKVYCSTGVVRAVMLGETLCELSDLVPHRVSAFIVLLLEHPLASNSLPFGWQWNQFASLVFLQRLDLFLRGFLVRLFLQSLDRFDVVSAAEFIVTLVTL